MCRQIVIAACAFLQRSEGAIKIMSNIEIVRVLLFLAVVGFIYGITLILIVRWFYLRFFLHELSPRPLSKGGKIILCLAFIGLFCMAYGHWIEPYWIEVSHVNLSSPKLSGATRPLRIAHISDLHCDPVVHVEDKMIATIANEKPDLIVFTGDTMNEAASLPVLKQTLTKVSAIAPTFVVKGNWDVWYYPTLDLFGGTGVRELKDEAVKFDVAGTSLWLIGSPVAQQPNFEKALAAVPPNVYQLLLYHYPDEIEAAKKYHVDLYCAGHTHGGQIALPFYGALLTFSKFGKKYEAGLFHEDETWLYVNRGIGIEGAPRFRFFARPEVTMIEISGQ